MILRYANGTPVNKALVYADGRRVEPMKFVEPPTCPPVDWTKLKAGDLLLTHGHQWYSGIIQDVQPYFASHALCVLRGPDGGLYVGSMEPPVGLVVPLRVLLHAADPVWACRLHVDLTPAQEATLWNYWQTKVKGKRYDFFLLPLLGVFCLWQRFSTAVGLPQPWRHIEPVLFGRVCSVAVAQGWQAAGLDPFCVNDASPYACSQEDFVGPVEQVKPVEQVEPVERGGK